MAELPQLARNLRGARRSAGYTQAQVAEKLGIHAITVSNWERGKFAPDEDTLEKLSALYEIAVVDLRYTAMDDQDVAVRTTGPVGPTGYDPRISMGERLRAARLAADLAREHAVVLGGRAQFSAKELASWEGGDAVPDVPALFYLASIYQVDPSWLYWGQTYEQMRVERSPLPQDALEIREKALLNAIIRGGADERSVVTLRAILGSDNFNRAFAENFGTVPDDDDYAPMMAELVASIAEWDFPVSARSEVWLDEEVRRIARLIFKRKPRVSFKASERAQLEAEPIPAPRGSGNFEQARAAAAAKDEDQNSRKPKGA